MTIEAHTETGEPVRVVVVKRSPTKAVVAVGTILTFVLVFYGYSKFDAHAGEKYLATARSNEATAENDAYAAKLRADAAALDPAPAMAALRRAHPETAAWTDADFRYPATVACDALSRNQMVVTGLDRAVVPYEAQGYSRALVEDVIAKMSSSTCPRFAEQLGGKGYETP